MVSQTAILTKSSLNATEDNMTKITRRGFVKAATAACAFGAGCGSSHPLARAEEGKRKFTMDLVCGAIGVRAQPDEAIQLAHKYGFESVQPSPAHLAGLSDGQVDELLTQLKERNLVWGAAGLPVNFRGDEATFAEGLQQLPKQADALRRAGATRVSTWLSPCHDSLTYVANFRQHARRLREVAKVLGDRGLRFGMEYVGPKTSWTAKQHPFVHTMAETKDLIAEIGLDNVGFVLDSWHWYTAHETGEDILTLAGKDVVACDLNDAPAGIPVDEQQDNTRELPAATGVIDLKTFLKALVAIGYDGPVRAEPFNKALNALDNEPAVRETSAAMKKAFSLCDAV
jgi:sugar phosphate isomerase/epimerase